MAQNSFLVHLIVRISLSINKSANIPAKLIITQNARYGIIEYRPFWNKHDYELRSAVLFNFIFKEVINSNNSNKTHLQI